MFQVTSEMIEKLKDALRLQPVPAVNRSADLLCLLRMYGHLQK